MSTARISRNGRRYYVAAARKPENVTLRAVIDGDGVTIMRPEED